MPLGKKTSPSVVSAETNQSGSAKGATSDDRGSLSGKQPSSRAGIQGTAEAPVVATLHYGSDAGGVTQSTNSSAYFGSRDGNPATTKKPGGRENNHETGGSIIAGAEKKRNSGSKVSASPLDKKNSLEKTKRFSNSSPPTSSTAATYGDDSSVTSPSTFTANSSGSSSSTTAEASMANATQSSASSSSAKHISFNTEPVNGKTSSSKEPDSSKNNSVNKPQGNGSATVTSRGKTNATTEQIIDQKRNSMTEVMTRLNQLGFTFDLENEALIWEKGGKLKIEHGLAIRDTLQVRSNLKQLRLKSTKPATPDVIQVLCDGLRGGSDSLEVLDLWIVGTPSDCVNICLSARKMTALKILRLGGTIGGEMGVRAFKVSSPLEELCFDYANGGKQWDTTLLCDGLRQNPTLQRLSLIGCPIGDEGAGMIGQALMWNANIQALKLERCGITKVGAEKMGLRLKMNNSLKDLDLGGYKPPLFGDWCVGLEDRGCRCRF